MKDVMVVSTCTHKAGLVDVYEQQLRLAGIDTGFECGPMPKATAYFSMQERINYWRNIVDKYNEYKMIVITDAWDVMFFGTKEEVMSKLQTFIISSERNCAPEDHYAGQIVSDKPCRYANPGMMACSPIGFLKWTDKAEPLGDLNFHLSSGSDQAWFNRRLANKVDPEITPLDDTTSLFYVVSWSSGHLEDGSLKIKNGRLWNSAFDTYPNFFHFAGHGNCEPLRILPGEGDPRYETQSLCRKMMQSMGWHSCKCGIFRLPTGSVMVPHP